MSQKRQSRLGARLVGQGAPLCHVDPTGTPVFKSHDVDDSVVNAFPSRKGHLYLRVVRVSNCSLRKVSFEVRIGFGS